MEKKNACPECGSSEIVVDQTRGEQICRSCGLVLDRIIDQGPEWRAFSRDERAHKDRTGAPVSNMQPDMGISSRLGTGFTDIHGRKLSSNVMVRMRRLRWLNNRTNKSEIRNLKEALRELKRLGSQLELSQDVIESASHYYRKALKFKLIRGRSIDSMIAAAVYIAARYHSVPLTLKDIEKQTVLDKKVLARCFRVYVKELGIKPNPADPNIMLDRLASELQLTSITRAKAIEILRRTREMKLDVGKSPMSVAAAAVYLAGIQTGERRTQQQVAKAAETTPVTLRNRFKEIVQSLDISTVQIKRGAAATPVYFKDPWDFT